MTQLTPNSIYIVLFSRGAEIGYHWGIMVTDINNEADLFHATNRSGSWQYERKTSYNFISSVSAITGIKIGNTDNTTKEYIHSILYYTPPTPKRGEYTCRVWTLNAVEVLQEYGILNYNSMDYIEHECKLHADNNKYNAELGYGVTFHISEYSS